MDTVFSIRVWNPSEISPVLLLLFLTITALTFVLFPYFLRQYRHYLQTVRFREEMDAMDLKREDSNILWELVKRYALNEPVKILYSLPLFDELAQKEMVRVLSHPYSSHTKMHYIDHLYGLRQKMYFESFHID